MDIDTASSSRLYHVKGEGWYFDSREGLHGPYFLRSEAALWLEQRMRWGERRAVVWSEQEREMYRLVQNCQMPAFVQAAP